MASQSVSMYSTNNQGANNMKAAADKIPSNNPYTAIAKAAIKGVAEFYSSQTKRRYLEAQSSSYKYEAQNYQMSADLARLDKKYMELSLKSNEWDIRNATQEVYNQYRMGEYQAMQQGLQDAQIIHEQRASTASSGVRMDSASKQEVDNSNVMAAKLNQKAIQATTWSNARQAQSAVRSAENQGQSIKKQMADKEMEIANYQAQAYIATGNAEASNIMAKSIKPGLNAVVEFGLSLAQSGAGGSFGGMGGASSAASGASSGSFDYTNFTSSLSQRSNNMMNARMSLGGN